MHQTISFDVNNGGTLTFVQEEHDGHVEAVTWDPEKDGVRGVRYGDIISAGDMVMLLNYYRYQKEHGKPIF